ncbi:protein of unknown function [Nitrospira japonica]|uniref:Uncharacterized protein n=1 Tax=Nitrospira japonica TaxID=1325564 RepID=A0A1W1I457_9BACT|nr:protein of unknown function [Nitrospira japonica]
MLTQGKGHFKRLEAFPRADTAIQPARRGLSTETGFHLPSEAGRL